ALHGAGRQPQRRPRRPPPRTGSRPRTVQVLRSRHRRAAPDRLPPSCTRRRMTKQRETRERVLDLIESLDVGDAIPSERQLAGDLGVSRLTVRESLFPGLSAVDLEEESFYELLTRRYAIEIVGGEQTVEPTVTDEEESETLGVPLHSPALLFERVTRSPNGEIVEFTVSIYRG